MDHSFEEIRNVIIDILARREKVNYEPSQFVHLKYGVAEVFQRREGSAVQQSMLGRDLQLYHADREMVREAFWDLFRQGVIMIGADDANEKFPFFSVTTYGKRVLDRADPYFFFDAESFENRIRQEIPDIDDTTLLYLKEAMQAFRVQPGGLRAISRRSPNGAPPEYRKNAANPGGISASLRLSSLWDAIDDFDGNRWYRFAQPPANRWGTLRVKPQKRNFKTCASGWDRSINLKCAELVRFSDIRQAYLMIREPIQQQREVPQWAHSVMGIERQTQNLGRGAPPSNS